MSLPKHSNGRCTNCGVSDFTLAQDFTEYSSCVWNNGEFVPTYGHEEESSADDAVRFFCAACGTRHEVPEELP